MASRNFFHRPLRSLKNVSYFLELYGLYFMVVSRLKKQGLKKTVTQCTALHRSTAPVSAAQEAEMVALTQELTRKVLKWHVLPNTCLPDSLLPCWFLARRGIKVDLVITVRPYPFMAHAQAYWQDIALTEPPPTWSAPEKFVPIMRK